ncbi:MAG: ABC transporter permease [Deltaproteobacteria bacterium]|jgi:putative ABC transport system permease protein|nr:ABC transporter permease [Deltaproteobacteria bacterium]
MYLPYILHELRNRSHRTAINIIGIAIGIALFVAVNAVATGYQDAVDLPFKDLGADMVVQRPEKGSAGQENRSMRGVRLPVSNQPIPAADRESLAALNHVAAASQALLLWEFLPGGFRTVMGVDLANPDLGPVRVKEWISQGRSLENPGEVLVEKHFAKFIRVNPGDTLQVGGKAFFVVGLLEIKEGVQIGASNIYLSLLDAQTLLPAETDPVNVMYLRLNDPAMQNTVRKSINLQMPALSVSSSDSFLELMGGVSVISGWFSRIVSAAALLGAGLLVLKSMTASLVERVPEIGVLKALGWTERNIQGQLFGEAMVQCLIGCVLGIVLGYIGAYLVGTIAIPMEVAWELNQLPASAKAETVAAQVMRLPISISVPLLLAACGFTLALGTIAAWGMGRSIARLHPALLFNRL